MDEITPGAVNEQPGLPRPTVAPGPAPKTNTLAVVSFISSFFFGLVGIITGHIALTQIRARGELGRGFAVAGLVIGYVVTASLAILVVFAVVFASAITAFFLAVGSTSLPSGPSAPPSSVTPAPNPMLPTGVIGAANFDGGYLEFGTGAVIIDEYIDPLCPYCAEFEQANGELLYAGVSSGVITLRVHALTFLDRFSVGTAYSSRASAALTCQATLNPESTLEYLSALFANQPQEQTPGLTNEQLADLAPGTASIIDCINGQQYEAWSQENTKAAVDGPIEGSTLPAVTGTPTVLVDGVPYAGSLSDTAEFSAFVAAAF